MKAVKSGNKKKGRNITVGAVVGFLLSCTVVMGADNYLWIKEDGGAIEFNTAITTDASGTDGNWNATNPYEENELNGNTYINNTVLSSSTNNEKTSSGIDKSYGLRLSGDLSGFNFVNNSLIAGVGGIEARGIVVGGGQRAESIYNDGLIIATSELDYIAFGICIIGHIDNSIVNNGSIIGIGTENGRGINLDKASQF